MLKILYFVFVFSSSFGYFVNGLLNLWNYEFGNIVLKFILKFNFNLIEKKMMSLLCIYYVIYKLELEKEFLWIRYIWYFLYVWIKWLLRNK